MFDLRDRMTENNIVEGGPLGKPPGSATPPPFV